MLLTGGLAGVVRSIIARLDARARKDVVPVEETLSDTDYEFPGKMLTISDVSKSFGGNVALKDVNLTASPGKVTAVIGPNGSGKTTLLNMICASIARTPDASTSAVLNCSRRGHTWWPARESRARSRPEHPGRHHGLRRGHRRSIHRAAGLPVQRNLPTPRFRRVRTADREEAESVLALVGLSSSRDAIATSLPLGMRRMLEVARCLIARPGLLLLDEVASGLDEHEIERLDAIIRKVVAGGGTVIVVEHNFQLVLNIADEIIALAHGEVMAQGSPAEIESNLA